MNTVTIERKQRVKNPPVIPTKEEIERIINSFEQLPEVICSIAAQNSPEGACACCFAGTLMDTISGC